MEEFVNRTVEGWNNEKIAIKKEVVLAIVGSQEKYFTLEDKETARVLIIHLLETYKPDLVVSGGASGIDSWAAKIARAAGFEVEEFLPENARWAPHGFMERNIKVAKRCTVLGRIAHSKSTTYGSGWTRDYAARLGKEVVEFEVG